MIKTTIFVNLKSKKRKSKVKLGFLGLYYLIWQSP